MNNKENKKAGKKIGIFLGAIGLFGLSYLGYWNLYASKFEKTENAYINANQDIITAQISGNISNISVVDTQLVKQGYSAMQIENIDFKIALDKAKNDLAKSIRNIKSLQVNQKQISENVLLKNIDLNKTKEDLSRDKSAYENGVLSKEQLDNSVYHYEQAKANLEIIKESFRNAQILAVSKTIQEHPDVAKAINQYKQAYLDLSRTNVIIPTTGIIAKKSAHIGQRVSINQPLLTVVDLNNEWVDANFKESQIEKIKIGQKVEVHSDVNNKKYTGYVSGIGAGSGSSLSLLPAQNATGNWIKVVQRVPVRINLDKDSIKEYGILPMGTSVAVKVVLEETKNTEEIATQNLELSYNESTLDKAIQQIINDNLKIGN